MNDAERQAVLYSGIWNEDPNYGTRESDVLDTVQHRIIPHMQRALATDRGMTLTVVDFGAGDGRFLRALHDAGMCWRGIGIDVYEPEYRSDWLQWERVPMWEGFADPRADYVISTDALEHLPPDRVNESLECIAATAPHGFLRISLIEDRYGTERGLHLHESVFTWLEWLVRLRNARIVTQSYRVYQNAEGKGTALEVWF